MKITNLKGKIILAFLIFAMAFAFGTCIMLSSSQGRVGYADDPETVTMVIGAYIRAQSEGDDADDFTGAGIRFAAKIDNYDMHDSNTKSYGMLIIPKAWFTTYSLDNDYHAKFDAASLVRGTDYADMDCLPNYGDVDKDGVDEWYIQGSLTNIKYANSNVSFVGVGYIYDDGNYTYAAYNEANNSRTMGYIASKAILGYDESSLEYATCAYYINRSVNKANNVVDDGTGAVNTSSDMTVSTNESAFALVVNDVTDLIVTQSPAMGFATVYESSNPSVATVDENGQITSVGRGACTITVSCGTLSREIDVTSRYQVGEFLETKGSTTYNSETGAYVPNNRNSMMLIQPTGFASGTLSTAITYVNGWNGSGTMAGLVFGLTESTDAYDYIRWQGCPHYAVTFLGYSKSQAVAVIYKITDQPDSNPSLAKMTSVASTVLGTDADEDGTNDFYGTAEQIAAGTPVTHTLAASWDGTHIKVFVDGVLKTTYTDASPYTGTGYGLWTYNSSNTTARPTLSDFQKSDYYIAYGDNVSFAGGNYTELDGGSGNDGMLMMTKSSGFSSGTIEATVDTRNTAWANKGACAVSNADGAGIVFALSDLGYATYFAKAVDSGWNGKFYSLQVNRWGQMKLTYTGTNFGLVGSVKFTDKGWAAAPKLVKVRLEFDGTNIVCSAYNESTGALVQMITATNTYNYTGTGYGFYGQAGTLFTDITVS